MITTEQSDRIRLMGDSEPGTRERAAARWIAVGLALAAFCLSIPASADLVRVEEVDAPCSGKAEWSWTGGTATDVWERAHWEYSITISSDGRYRLSARHQGRCHESAPRDQPLADAAHFPDGNGTAPLPAAGSGFVTVGTRVAIHPTEAGVHEDRHVFAVDRDPSGAARLTIFSSHGDGEQTKVPGASTAGLALAALAMIAVAVRNWRHPRID